MTTPTTLSEKANLKMVTYLMDKIKDGTIDEEDNNHDYKFVNNMHFRITHDMPLTERQESYLEKCFHEKY